MPNPAQQHESQQQESHPPFLKEVCESCKDTPPNPNNQPHDCVEAWKDKLKSASNLLETESAMAVKSSLAFTNATLWQGKLKGWLDDATQTHEKAMIVSTELGRFFGIVERLEGNTQQTAKAVEILLCQAKDIFYSVNDLLRVGTSSSDSLGKLQALKKLIECMKELGEKERQDALACIAPYEAKMLAVAALQEALLKVLLDILYSANLAACAMGNSKRSRGLKWQIEDLLKRIVGESMAKAKVEACGCHEHPHPPPAAESPCGAIAPSSGRLLPIKAVYANPTQTPPQQQQQQQQQTAPLAPSSDYYLRLEKFYKDATKKTLSYQGEYQAAKQKSDMAAALKNSLTDAIKAAEEAEAAK